MGTPLVPMCHPGDPKKAWKRPVSYTTSLSDLRQLMDQLGYDGREFGEHSMKRGAATSSHEAGVADVEIQREGGWTNPKTVSLYIDRDPKNSQKLAKKLASNKKR